MIARRLLSIGIVMAILQLLCGCGEKAVQVFSSRKSPDGTRVIENDLEGAGEGVGRLVLTSKDGARSEFLFGEPAPNVFVRWTDDTHVEVWNESWNGSKPPGPDRLGDVHVDNRTYVPPHDIAAAFSRPDMPAKRIDVAADDVVATSSTSDEEARRHCVLTLVTAPSVDHEPAKVEISATANPNCQGSLGCTGLWTRFSQGHGEEAGRQTMVTQATISNIPSYNRLAVGDDGTSLRGQFLGKNAAKLVDLLKGRSITLQFALDFFEGAVAYDLPLTAVRKQTQDFLTCVGGAGTH